MNMSKKELLAQASRLGCKVLRVGYCDAQHLLADIRPFATNSGAYGWNWDAYVVGSNTIICAGYRNLCGTRDTYVNVLNKLVSEHVCDRGTALEKLIEHVAEEF